MNRNNLEKLIEVIRSGEAESLAEKLRAQKGSYTFDLTDRPRLAMRDPINGPAVLTVNETYIYDDGVAEYIMVAGTCPAPNDIFKEVSVAVDVEADTSILPGEVQLLSERIPWKHIDPALIQEGWKKLAGRHACKTLTGEDASVTIDADSRTITVRNDENAQSFSGKQADEMVHDTMAYIVEHQTPDTDDAIQDLYEKCNIDLPF